MKTGDIILIGLLSVLLASCDTAGPDPSEDAPLVAFTIYYPGRSVVALGHLDDLTNYQEISPQDFGTYSDPRFTPSKAGILFRDDPGITYLYDIEADTSAILMDNNGHINVPLQSHTRTAVWNTDEQGFYFLSAYVGASEPWDVREFRLPDSRSTSILNTHALQFAISPNELVVRGPAADPSDPSQLHIFDIQIREMIPITNSFLIIPSSPLPSSPRAMQDFEWIPERELIAVAAREVEMQAWNRYVAITDQEGTFVTRLTTTNYRYQKLRWGPENSIYAERFDTEADYRAGRNIRLLAINIDTQTIRDVVSFADFPGAIGIGSCDF